ncbi:MAG: nucleotide pyrophosphatase [Candidatus Aminicenantes bacterium RBG_13_63_10]|nr:MAG: nucleotide pyrophosphatase [Candidatus Aminicenantes bacterium RBG_13_63_10]
MSILNTKILILGLDCATPDIVFDRANDFPVLRRLQDNGLWGTMRSSDPPITIPAWMVMCTGLDAARLGVYGFRHRTDYSYDRMWTATSKSFPDKKLWDYVGERGGRSVLVSVPPSYPPYPVPGELVSCFITPGPENPYTYPAELKAELESRFGPYIFDAEFRTDDRDLILKKTYEMTDQRFAVLDYLLTRKLWNLFMFVEIGVDRMHHTFWKYHDRAHHLYEPGNRYEKAIIDYYKHVDAKLGELLAKAGDDTLVLAISDHGAKRMKGAFCINHWLVDQGLLTMKEIPAKPVTIEKLPVDWSRTKAWGWGGYYARIFLNVEGREPAGIVPAEDYERFRDELAAKIMAIRGPNGEKWETKVIKPQEHWEELNGDYPDLMVYFDDLFWRSAGTLGHKGLYLAENDTGPDDAVHAQEGMYILYDPRRQESKRRDIDILDVAPTVLDRLGLPVPKEMKGKIIR